MNLIIELILMILIILPIFIQLKVYKIYVAILLAHAEEKGVSITMKEVNKIATDYIRKQLKM